MALTRQRGQSGGQAMRCEPVLVGDGNTEIREGGEAEVIKRRVASIATVMFGDGLENSGGIKMPSLTWH